MPIHIDELKTQVDVQTSDTAAAEPASPTATPEALARWQQLARREQELQARTLAWNFDD